MNKLRMVALQRFVMLVTVLSRISMSSTIKADGQNPSEIEVSRSGKLTYSYPLSSGGQASCEFEFTLENGKLLVRHYDIETFGFGSPKRVLTPATNPPLIFLRLIDGEKGKTAAESIKNGIVLSRLGLTDSAVTEYTLGGNTDWVQLRILISPEVDAKPGKKDHIVLTSETPLELNPSLDLNQLPERGYQVLNQHDRKSGMRNYFVLVPDRLKKISEQEGKIVKLYYRDPYDSKAEPMAYYELTLKGTELRVAHYERSLLGFDRHHGNYILTPPTHPGNFVINLDKNKFEIISNDLMQRETSHFTLPYAPKQLTVKTEDHHFLQSLFSKNNSVLINSKQANKKTINVNQDTHEPMLILSNEMISPLNRPQNTVTFPYEIQHATGVDHGFLKLVWVAEDKLAIVHKTLDLFQHPISPSYQSDPLKEAISIKIGIDQSVFNIILKAGEFPKVPVISFDGLSKKTHKNAIITLASDSEDMVFEKLHANLKIPSIEAQNQNSSEHCEGTFNQKN